MSGESAPSIRKRILDATYVVLAKSGRDKLQLLEVAAEAGVSRPTVYRYFGSREGLLDAFALYEQDNFGVGMAAATAGLRGDDRIDAALQFIVDYHFTHSHGALVEQEPEYSIAQMNRVLPAMEKAMHAIMTGEHADVAAEAVVRIAVCHYLVPGGDRNRFLAQLRHTAGINVTRRN